MLSFGLCYHKVITISSGHYNLVKRRSADEMDNVPKQPTFFAKLCARGFPFPDFEEVVGSNRFVHV